MLKGEYEGASRVEEVAHKQANTGIRCGYMSSRISVERAYTYTVPGVQDIGIALQCKDFIPSQQQL